MIVKNQTGQTIEFRQKIDGIGWELWIRYGKKEIAFELTDEEVKWLELDLRKRLNIL